MSFSSVAYRQLSDGNPNGTVLGRSGDLIGFYGVTTPVPLSSGATSVVVMVCTGNALTAQSASTGGQGFSTAAQFAAYMSTVIQMQTDIQALTTNLNAIHVVMSSMGFYRGS